MESSDPSVEVQDHVKENKFFLIPRLYVSGHTVV